ncbi:MAG TPA: OmpH family outer membrane protein [bacterium]
MKRWALIFIPLLMFSKEAKIGFVESSKIFAEYQATAAANSQFNMFVSTYRESAAVLQQNIEKMKSELEAQKLLLSEEARLKKLDEIETSTRTYNQFLQEAFGTDGKIEQKNSELMAPLLKKINDAVTKIALQEGFSIVLDLSQGVFYASSELNITDIVVSELNREFGPATVPGSEIKKAIGIFPLREENTEAMTTELGQKCQTELYNALNAYSQQYKIVSSSTIRAEIARRQLGRNIDDGQALNMALTPLLCDYIVTGQVTKFSTKIDYTLTFIDVSTKQEIDKRVNSITDDIKLQEALANDLRAMMSKLKE